jgi:hypothetical protein
MKSEEYLYRQNSRGCYSSRAGLPLGGKVYSRTSLLKGRGRVSLWSKTVTLEPAFRGG